MGWASGFRAGSDVARQAIDTYERTKLQRDLEPVMKSQPVESQGYSPDEIKGLLSAKDASGNPYYTIDPSSENGLQVRSNFAYQGADGGQVDPGAVTGLQQRRVADFLGQRYDAEALTPQKVAALRYNAAADVVGQVDPLMGLRMRREAAKDEREAEQFDWQRQDRPLERETKQLAVKGLQRQDRQGQRVEDVQSAMDRAMKMPLADLEKEAVNVTKSGYPLLFAGKNKDGYTFLGTAADGVTPTGQTFQLTEAQMRQMAAAHYLADAGFGAEALQQLTTADKAIGEHIGRWNSTLSAVATTNNAATHNANQDQTSRITAQAAASTASSTASLRDEQVRGLREARENRDAAAKIAAEYAALSPQDQAGPKGQGLIRQYNMANVKAGGTVPLGSGKVQPEMKVNADGTVTMGNKLYVPDPKKPGSYIEAKGFGPSQLDIAIQNFQQGQGGGAQPKPAAGLKVPPGAPQGAAAAELQVAELIMNMNPFQVDAYTAMQRGEPLTPLQRQELRKAGIQF